MPPTATFEGHDSCVRCHLPHSFLKAEVAGCSVDCHTEVHALGQDRVAQHRGCIGCHDNHDVRGSPREACERCHARRPPEHPVDSATGTRCLGCHPPHAGRGAPTARACSECHREPVTDAGFHQGPERKGPQCRDCHAPHTFAAKGRGAALCRSCHTAGTFENATVVRPHESHADCMSCHPATAAHSPADERKPCATCHELQGALVREGHDDCKRCHEPHSTELVRACGSCHEAQLRSAPPDHRTCRSCHEPHSSRVTKACTDCHADRAGGNHAKVEGSCRSCHRPHGIKGSPAPPPCTSCHAPDALPFAHVVSGHKTCEACHRSHGKQPYRSPQTCLGCHESRRNHEPEAKSCIGCHEFGASP